MDRRRSLIFTAAAATGAIAIGIFVSYEIHWFPVTASKQFAWSFQYPPSVTGGRPVESDQLYLPKGESVQFKIHSKDVIHAFWVPAFRLQIDAVPGITTSYRATPDRLGTYPVVCNLLCGLGHALMRSNVKVVQPARFQAWLKSRQGVSTTAAPGKASE